MYVQCAQVLQYPRFAERLGHGLAALFANDRIEAVVSPAMGGLIIGQEVARALPEPAGSLGGGTPAMFVERDASGNMTLRRGFCLKPGQRVLVTTLAEIDPAVADMSSVVIVGSASTRIIAGRMVTPRGYTWQRP